MTIGERIKRKLNECGQSQKWLAWKTGVTESAISRIINDERGAKASNVIRIAKALGTTTDYLLLGDKGEEENEFTSPEEQAIHFLQVQFGCDDCRKTCDSGCPVAVAIKALNHILIESGCIDVEKVKEVWLRGR